MTTPQTQQSGNLIDPATGMKPGERYRIEQVAGAHVFDGFFLDGKYFLEADLLTAVGWLEAQRFVYDRLQADGEPQFAERHAGDISDLRLTLVDGTVLELSPFKVQAQVEPGVGPSAGDRSAAQATDPADAEQAEQPTRSESTRPPAPAHAPTCPVGATVQVLAAAAAALLVGLAAGLALSRHRR